MALSDVELNIGSGGAKIAVDVIGGDAFEVVKMAFGVEGVAILVSDVNPLPMYNVNSTSLQFLTSTAGQTVFTFIGVPALYSDYIIFVNGIAFDPITDFTTSGNNVTMVVPRDLNDRVRFQRIQG